MAKRLVVDLAVCTKSGECYYNHPSLFSAGSDGLPIPADRAIGEDDMENAEQAIEVCPVQAIRLAEVDGG